MSYKIFVDGEKLYADDLNNRFSSIILDAQTINVSVSVGDLVYFDVEADEWIVSAELTPIGIYVGDDKVMVSGVVVNLSGLTPGSAYWMNATGGITANSESAFNGTRVGYAKSETELFFKIRTTGENEPVQKAVTPTSTLFSGLLVYYDFDGEGPNVRDKKNGLIGDLNYNHPWAPERHPGVIGTSGDNLNSFVGLSDYNVGISGAQPRTMSAWIYVKSWFFGSGLLGWGGRSGGNDSVYFRDSGSNNFEVDFFNTRLYGSGGYSTGQWYHLAVTYNGTVARFYIDGSEVSNTTVSLNTTDGILYSQGLTSGSGTSRTRIDEIMIFNRELNSTEISQLYNSGNGLPYEESEIGIALRNFKKYKYLNDDQLNKNINNVKLVDQSFSKIPINVASNRNLANSLRFPEEDGEWRLCVQESNGDTIRHSPVGMFYRDSMVFIGGLIPLGVPPGKFYYMDEDGMLTDDINNSFNKTKIGYSLNDDIFLLDIETLGNNVPQSLGFGELYFSTTVAERQFAGMTEGVHYEVDGNTLKLNPNFHYKFNSFYLGLGTTLTLTEVTEQQQFVLVIECEEDFESQGTIDLNNKLLPGRFTTSWVYFNGVMFIRPMGGIAGATDSISSTGFGFGHGGDGRGGNAGYNSSAGENVVSNGGNGGSGGATFGPVGGGGNVQFSTSCPSGRDWCIDFYPGWGYVWSDGGNSIRSAGGTGGATLSYTSINTSHLSYAYGYGGMSSGGHGADGDDGNIFGTFTSGSSTNMIIDVGGGGGNGGMAGTSGAHLYIRANNIILAGTVDSSGTNGGNGGNGGRTRRAQGVAQIESGGFFNGTGAKGGSGGGGGTGGNVRLEYYNSISNTATINLSKGLGGAGGFRASGSGWSSEQQGSGEDGTDGSVTTINLS